MKSITRRSFLSRGAAAVGPLLLLERYGTARGQESPNGKLNIAGIGIGGMGGGNLRNLERQNVVALCDVDHEYAAKTLEAFPKARRYTDYRELLTKETDVDGVVIATPDHTHAVITVAAMRAGKHVYCQKPLTHTVQEARTVARVAKETGVVTQMGIQGHSADGNRTVNDWINAGVIGEVREVDAWCDLTYYPWGHASWSSALGTRPTETPPLPEGLDWDLWIGPAPMRPYHSTYHPRTWRSWWDFGCGMMGDRGVHTFDPIFWALDLGHPDTIEAHSTELNPETHPISCIVRYAFPARGKKPPVVLTWYDGVRPPLPVELGAEDVLGNTEGGALFKGSEGYLTCGVYGENPRLLPASRVKDFTPPDPVLPRLEWSHEMDWVKAIQNGGKACADFAYSAPLTEATLLGNIAKRMNTKLTWDGEAMQFTSLPEANQYVHKTYREGWHL